MREWIPRAEKAMREAAKVVLAALREIFDENAYARFLAAHGITNTREAYAHYLRETNHARERRARCC